MKAPVFSLSVLFSLLLTACGGGSQGSSTSPASTGSTSSASSSSSGTANSSSSTSSRSSSSASSTSAGTVTTDAYPAAGNSEGNCAIPGEAAAEDVSTPTTVVGTGTPASCTSAGVVAAIAKGGVVTFNCGSAPVTITLGETAKIYNNASSKVVIDGGDKVTLSGGGVRRILYMNTCDSSLVWTTSHCDNQETPQLTVQNLTFINGNAAGASPEGSGGAIFARGGRLKIVNSRFFSNSCDASGPDVGGAAVRAYDQYNDLPLYVTNSTFGGRSDLGNSCSNGGGLSSIGVSYSVINSLFSYNKAIGSGANPARSGTPGGGSGGAIYNDGNTFNLGICGTKITNNTANEGGGAIFFVSNDNTGTLSITNSTLSGNVSSGFETSGYPGIFFQGSGTPGITNSSLQ